MTFLRFFLCYFIAIAINLTKVQSDSTITNQDYNLTICSFDNEPYTMNCPIGYTFDILNATLYDFKTCSYTDSSLVVVQKILQRLCYTETSCSIFKSQITQYYQKYANLDTLGIIILYNCEKANFQQAQSDSAYSFIYFFYIMTLVLSSSCILIGAIFILKRFVIMRRANRRSGRYIRNNGFSLESISGANTNSSGIWSTHFPPSYENIYNSSMPINPPPDYEAAKKKNCKLLKESNNLNVKIEVTPFVSYHSAQNQDANQSSAHQMNDLNVSASTVEMTESHVDQNIKTSKEHKSENDGIVSIEYKIKNNDYKAENSGIYIEN